MLPVRRQKSSPNILGRLFKRKASLDAAQDQSPPLPRPSARRYATEPTYDSDLHPDHDIEHPSVSSDKSRLSSSSEQVDSLGDSPNLRPSHSASTPYLQASEFGPSLQIPIPELSTTPFELYKPLPETPMTSTTTTPESSYGPASPDDLASPLPPGSPAPQVATPESVDDTLEALEQYVEQFAPKPHEKSTTLNALKHVEEKADTVKDVIDIGSAVAQVAKPIANEVVNALKTGLDAFLEQCPILMKSLDEVAKIHPVITAVVVAFKAVYGMWQTLRDNDKRVITLYVSMKDMLVVLLGLRPITHENSPEAARAQMKSLSDKAAKEIEACANVCDMYLKKSSLVKVLNGHVWEAKLAEWIEKFTDRKMDFQLVLAVYTAGIATATNNAVSLMDKKVDGLSGMLAELIRQLTPNSELELAEKVDRKGGAQAVVQNETALQELFLSQTGKSHSAAVGFAMTDYGTNDMKTRSTKETSKPIASFSSFHDLKKELLEDWDTAVNNNFKAFEGKFLIEQQRLQVELEAFIKEESNRVIAAVNGGPYELIKDEALKRLWREMNWRRNVKSRFFVMTLRDNFSDIVAHTTTPSADKGNDDPLHSDHWAFEYISIAYLQPIMEAFDEDGSGYTTVFEVNRFVDSLPEALDWSLPRWLAYWAIGWELVSTDYCKKILEIFAHMFVMRSTVLPENRLWVDFYLHAVWKTGAELTMPLSLRSHDDLPESLEGKFRKYVEYEESRIERNLEKIKYDIDALDTVYIVAGPERIDKALVRIEKHVYPLLYLLLRRDLCLFELAKTEVLGQEELWDAATSIQWVYYAISARHADLKAHFIQQKLDDQMKTFACGMFEYYPDQASLFGMSTLATRTYDGPNGEAPIVNRDKIRDFANYPMQHRHRLKCKRYPVGPDEAKEGDVPVSQQKCDLYECQPQSPSHEDLQATMPIKAILGQWNGYTYNSNGFYPNWYMRSFHIHASSKEGQDFESSGYYYGVEFTLSGKCDQDCDGNISVIFVIQYSEDYPIDYLSGHLLPDGSLIGTSGTEENPSNHMNKFILKRTSAEVMCHRPSPERFLANKSRALWEFAFNAVYAQVLREMWSWKHFARRRDARIRHLRLDLHRGRYGRPLDDEGLNQLVKGMQSMTLRDANFYRLSLDWHLKSIACHHDYACDACGGGIGGARLVCLDCQPPTAMCWQTVDLCDDPKCYEATLELERLERPHTPHHDIVKVRTALQFRDLPDINQRARRALDACGVHFKDATAEAHSGSQALQDGDIHEPPEHHSVHNMGEDKEAVSFNEDDAVTHDETLESIPHSKGSYVSDTDPRCTEHENGDIPAIIRVHEADEPMTNIEDKESEKPDSSKSDKHLSVVHCAPDQVTAKSRPHLGLNLKDLKNSLIANLMPLTPGGEVKPEETSGFSHGGTVCGICGAQTQRPCWFCVDCYDHDINMFICDGCENNLKLRCTKCKSLYKQPSWYYGIVQEAETFMCSKCRLNHKDPPPVESYEHTYVHALVRCKLPHVATEERITTLEDTVNAVVAKVNTLDTTVNTLDTKVDTLSGTVNTLDAKVEMLDAKVGMLDNKLSRLEDGLTRIESKLGLLLANLKLDGVKE